MKTTTRKRTLETHNREVAIVTLRNLTGVAAPVTAAVFASRTAGMRGLMRYGAITTGQAVGMINVWRDDSGKYRCELLRNGVATIKAEWQFLATVDAWLKENLPKLRKA